MLVLLVMIVIPAGITLNTVRFPGTLEISNPTGFSTVLLIYIWLDEFWLAAYNVPDYAAEAEKIPRLVVFHPASLVAGLVLVAATVIYKKVFAADAAGFPSYFCFLVAIGLVPATGFLRTVRPFVNWRAFSFTLLLIVLISLLPPGNTFSVLAMSVWAPSFLLRASSRTL